MKVFAIATILAAAVSAAPTKDTKNLFPSPIGAIPPYGVVSPPLNSGNPPLNGVVPPVNGVVPPVNGVIPPVNNVIPPVNGGNPTGGHGNTLLPPPPVAGNKSENSDLCPSGLLYTNPQCCGTDVIGLVDLDCSVPSRTPTDVADFNKICAETGKQAHCCAVPVAGQGVLCQDVPLA